MARGGQRVSLYLDAAAVKVRLDDAALLVCRSGKADQRIPVSRVQRAVIRNVSEPLLEVCLALAASGGSVHFEDGQGRIWAVLQPSRPLEGKGVRDLAAIIAHSSGAGPFNEWRGVQLRHAVSLAFHRDLRGDIVAARRRLLRYLQHYRPEIEAEAEFGILSEQLRAWLQAQLYQRGLQPVVRELALKGCELATVLEQCLGVTLLWAYVRWRKEQGREVGRRRLLELLELQAAAPLSDQLQRHLAALAAEYQASLRLRREAERADEEVADDLPPADALVREESPL